MDVDMTRPTCNGSLGKPGCVLLGVHRWTETGMAHDADCDGSCFAGRCPVPVPIYHEEPEYGECPGCSVCHADCADCGGTGYVEWDNRQVGCVKCNGTGEGYRREGE